MATKNIYPDDWRYGNKGTDKKRQQWKNLRNLYEGEEAYVLPKDYIHPARLFLKIPLDSVPKGVLITNIKFNYQHARQENSPYTGRYYLHYHSGLYNTVENWRKSVKHINKNKESISNVLREKSYTEHSINYKYSWFLEKDTNEKYCLISYHNIKNPGDYLNEKIRLRKVYATVTYTTPQPALNINFPNKKEQKIEEGKDFTLNLKPYDKKKTKAKFRSKVTLPSQISYTGCDGGCTVNQQNNTLTITHKKKDCQLFFKVNTINESSQITLEFLTETVDNPNFNCTTQFKFDIEKTTLKGTIIDLTEDDEYVSVETTKKYNLTFEGPADISSKTLVGLAESAHIDDFEIKDPDGAEVELHLEEEHVETADDIYLKVYSFTAQAGTYTAELKFKSAGEDNPYIMFQTADGSTKSFNYLFIQSQDYFTEFCSAKTVLSDAEKSRMIDDDFYCLQVYAKVTSEEYDEGEIIPDYRQNHRICLEETYTETDEDTNETETITNHYWSYNRVEGYNLPEYTLLTVYFVFNKDADYTIYLYGEPVGDGAFPESTYFIHSNPCIQHDDFSDADTVELSPLREQEGIDTLDFNLINENIQNGERFPLPSGIELILYNYIYTEEEEDEDIDKEITAVSGISIEATQEVISDESEEDKNLDDTGAIQTTIVTDKRNSTRTILPDSDGKYQSGSRTDDFNLNQDIIHPEDVRVHIKNPTLYTNLISDFSITLHSFTPVESKYNMYVEYDDEFIDLSKYGVFLQDVQIEGMKTDTKYIHVPGSDENIPVLQTLKPKQLNIHFDILGETLEESSELLEHVQALLINDKDEYNIPIEKSIMFDHYPERIWEYIIEDGIDATVNYNRYKCNVKLKIPSGCSYTNEILTGAEGAIRSSFPINPTLLLKITAEGKNLRISEPKSNQEMLIYNDASVPFVTNQYIQINCEDRIVLVESDDDDIVRDITDQVDFGSDWFVLNDDYHFEYENCSLQKVAYYLKKVL